MGLVGEEQGGVRVVERLIDVALVDAQCRQVDEDGAASPQAQILGQGGRQGLFGEVGASDCR